MRLEIDGIPVEVNRKQIKHMYLYVKPPEGEVTVSAPLRMPGREIERFVREKKSWIEKRRESYRTWEQEACPLDERDRAFLREEIGRLLPKWEERTGLHCSCWQIRDMKTRWGSCNTRTGKLWFALMLARQPEECVEYVVLHELAHLYEPSHNARFWAFLDLHMPEWREIRRKMRKNHENKTGQF